MTTALRHALRLIGRQPGFAAAAIASLAIGIGANTTIFSVANALLLGPTTGIAAPGRLVDVGMTRPNSAFDTMSYPTFADMRDRNRTLSGMYAYELEPKALSLGGDDGATRLYGHFVSAGFFEVLGAVPARGAFPRAADERVGVPLRVVVLSDRAWRRQFGADPSVVGREIRLNGEPFRVTAVAAPGFQGPTVLAPDVWVPVTAAARNTPTDALLRSRTSTWLIAGGRLRDGVTLADARADLNRVVSALDAEFPDAIRHQTAAVTPSSRLPGEIGGAVAPVVGALAVIVGLVLLLACTNLAGLLLARAAGRHRELVVRSALGARRWHLVRELVAESLVLFAAGGTAALLLARWMTRALWSLLPSLPVPIEVNLAPDWRLIAFTFGLALLAGLVTGLVPALAASRVSLTSGLKRDVTAPARQRLRHVVVGAQVALCLLLLVVAGLLLHSLKNAAAVSPGFRVDGIAVAELDLGIGGYAPAERAAVTERLVASLAQVPGVARVAVAAMVPLDGGGLGLGPLRPKGATDPQDRLRADWNIVSPDFLPALEIPLVAGRGFTSADRVDGPKVAIVNERFAALAWPGQDPVGRQLENGQFDDPTAGPIDVITVVGVARDAKYRWIGEQPRPFIYVPLAQQPWNRIKLFTALASGARRDVSADVRAAVARVDADLPVISQSPLADFAALGMLPQRIAASVAGAFGAVAMILAAIGLYAVLAYVVAQRTREIGVRMALGADPRAVVRLVLARGLMVAGIGGAIGLALASAAGVALSAGGLLFGVSAVDPWAFGLAAGLAAAMAAAAAYVPARRASRVDPLIALRAD